jgi:uncharacterized membrane protein
MPQLSFPVKLVARWLTRYAAGSAFRDNRRQCQEATMESRVRALGHPVHPMLVMFPGALLITGTIFDVVQVAGDNRTAGEVGFWMVTAGIIGGVLAAVTGLADWTKIPAGTRAKRIGKVHGLCNAAAMVLFVIAWATRIDEHRHAGGAGSLILQIAGVLILGVSAWLGGELVDRLGIGVSDEAHPDASSSLSAGRQTGSRAAAVAHDRTS